MVKGGNSGWYITCSNGWIIHEQEDLASELMCLYPRVHTGKRKDSVITRNIQWLLARIGVNS